MSGQVKAAVDALHRFSAANAEAVDQLYAANDVLELALDDLRRTSEAQFAVSGLGTLADLQDHVVRSRVLGEAFDLAATRFEKTQDTTRAMVPRVFGDYPAGFIGPTPPGRQNTRGEVDKDGRTWLADRLRDAAGRSPSATARAMEANYRRLLGLFDDRPYVVAVHAHRLWVGGEVSLFGLVSFGRGSEQDWTIVELSDGSALVTVSSGQSADLKAAKGGSMDVVVGDRHAGYSEQGEVALGVAASQARTKHFASLGEAEAAMAHRDLAGFVGVVAGAIGAVPGLGGLAGGVVERTAPRAMADAPRTARSIQVGLGTQLAYGATVGTLSGRSRLGADGQVTLVEERDREAATITDVMSASADLPPLVAALLPMAAPATAASVAVTRQDATGVAQTLTVRLAFDAAPGLAPSLDPAEALGALPPRASGSGGGGGSWSSGGGAEATHRYDIAVEVDLTDPANRSLADGLSSNAAPSGRVEEDLRALARAVDLDAEVLARSPVTVLEQAVSGPHGLGVSGTPLEGGDLTTDLVTVGAWHNVGGQMRPM